MNLPISRIAAYATILLAPLALAACGGDDEESDALPFGLTTEVVTTGDHVSDMVFDQDGRMFFAEQFTGRIRVIDANGTVREQPFAQLDVANWLDLDWGLTGLALDPEFETNHYVYAFYSRPEAAPAGTPAAGSPTLAATATPEAATPQAGGPPAIQTPPGPGETTAPTAEPEAQTQGNPVAQPVLVRFTERNGIGEELTIISDDFPLTEQRHAGYNANGNIRFGPDGMLYVTVGDYDYATEPVALDLSSPVGKVLRIDPATGEAPPDNPYVDDDDADPRVFAIGFREPFDIAFHPESEAIYGTDNTPYTCEELNIIRGGENYGWPDVGEFPYAECGTGDQVDAIYYFARDGKQPGEFVSLAEVTGLAFTPASAYAALGDSLFVCEGHRSVIEGESSPGVLRRLVLSGDFTEVSADDLITDDCKGDIEAAPDGTLYYANATEIRRLLPGATGTPAASE
jgi:glucose/arabinose dehydrogenase